MPSFLSGMGEFGERRYEFSRELVSGIHSYGSPMLAIHRHPCRFSDLGFRAFFWLGGQSFEFFLFGQQFAVRMVRCGGPRFSLLCACAACDFAAPLHG